MFKRTCFLSFVFLLSFPTFGAVGPAQGQERQPTSDDQEHPPALRAETPESGSSGVNLGMPQIHHDPALADIAREYLESLLLGHYDTTATFLTADSHYQDFSMEFFGREMVDLKGGKAITKFWQESSQASGAMEVRFDDDRFFIAGPNVYFIGTASVTSEGRAWGVDADVLEFTFSQISHIRLVDGKVTYHADHVDYFAVFDQLRKFRDKFGAYVPDVKD